MFHSGTRSVFLINDYIFVMIMWLSTREPWSGPAIDLRPKLSRKIAQIWNICSHTQNICVDLNMILGLIFAFDIVVPNSEMSNSQIYQKSLMIWFVNFPYSIPQFSPWLVCCLRHQHGMIWMGIYGLFLSAILTTSLLQRNIKGET